MGAALLAALVVGLALVLTVQFVVLRPRPDGVRLLTPAPAFPSFPSGHAMSGFATATVLALSARRRPVTALACAGAVLLALSRVYLGHHYPTDVMGGAALGAGVGAAAHGLCVERGPGWRAGAGCCGPRWR